MITKINPCKFCGETTHYPFQCRLNPKREDQLKKKKANGKIALEWERIRRMWFKANPGPYNCFYCGKPLSRTQVTLDHYHSRSRRPDLRFEPSNIVPACFDCNGLKGSLSGDEFKLKRSAA